MNTALDPASSAGRRIKIVNEFMNPYIRGDDFYAKTTPLNCHSGLDPESSPPWTSFFIVIPDLIRNPQRCLPDTTRLPFCYPLKKPSLDKINGKYYAFYAWINKSVISVSYVYYRSVTRINWLGLFFLSHAHVGTFLIKKLFFAVFRAYFLGTLTQL